MASMLPVEAIGLQPQCEQPVEVAWLGNHDAKQVVERQVELVEHTQGRRDRGRQLVLRKEQQLEHRQQGRLGIPLG